MAFLTALLTGIGGYGQGRQQATQNQQNQEQIDQQGNYQNAELGIQQQDQKNKQQAQQRLMGIDPTTGLPFQVPKNLQQVAPNNKGKAATDAQTLTHLYAYANWLNQTGQDLTPVLDRAKAMEADIRANNSLLERQQLDFYNQQQSDARTQAIIGGEDARRNEITPYQSEDLELRREEMQNREANVGRGKPPSADAVQDARVKWQNAFTKATTSTLHPRYKDPTTNKAIPGSPTEGKGPLVDAKSISDLRSRLQNLKASHGYNGPVDPFSAIDADPDPIALSQQLSKMTGNPTLKSLLLERGRVANMSKQQTSGSVGGSQGAGNPTNGGQRLPQRSIWQMLIDNGATPDEATKLTAIAYAESGGDPTSVNPTDNHGKQTSWGLFQISDGTHNEPQGWQDPEVNTQMAIAKLRSKQGLHAWGTYNSGAYQQFLPNAGVANK